MEQREKLIELLCDFYYSDNVCTNCKHNLETDYVCNQCITEHEVDHLLTNGVVVLPCRCGECESFSEGMCDNKHIGAMVFRMKREPTDYCSYAKRKGGDYCDEE